MLIRVLYGFDMEDRDNRVLNLIWATVEGTRELLISGGFLMDFLPILRFAPSFVPFQRKLTRWRTVNVRFKEELFAQYKARQVRRSRYFYLRTCPTSYSVDGERA